MIDWTRLNALKADIGADDFADVAQLFVSEIGTTLTRLAEGPDRATSADFHFLRGSAANLGFEALSRLCSTAEEACKSGDTPDIAAIAQVFHASVAVIASDLPEPDAA